MKLKPLNELCIKYSFEHYDTVYLKLDEYGFLPHWSAIIIQGKDETIDMYEFLYRFKELVIADCPELSVFPIGYVFWLSTLKSNFIIEDTKIFFPNTWIDKFSQVCDDLGRPVEFIFDEINRKAA